MYVANGWYTLWLWHLVFHIICKKLRNSRKKIGSISRRASSYRESRNIFSRCEAWLEAGGHHFEAFLWNYVSPPAGDILTVNSRWRHAWDVVKPPRHFSCRDRWWKIRSVYLHCMVRRHRGSLVSYWTDSWFSARDCFVCRHFQSSPHLPPEGLQGFFLPE